MRVLHDYVVIFEVTEEASTSSGFVLPETYKNQSVKRGKVFLVGEGTDKPLPFKTDDTVYFLDGNHRIELQGKTMFFVEFKNVLAVI